MSISGALLEKAFRDNLVDDLGIETLDDEKKLAVLNAVSDLIESRVIAKISAHLGAPDREVFISMSEEKEPEEVFAWLAGKGVVIEEVITEEIAHAKEEMRARAAGIK